MMLLIGHIPRGVYRKLYQLRFLFFPFFLEFIPKKIDK